MRLEAGMGQDPGREHEGGGRGGGVDGDWNGNGNGNEGKRAVESDTWREFCDHQVAVYNRCEDVLGAVLPLEVVGWQRRPRRERNSTAGGGHGYGYGYDGTGAGTGTGTGVYGGNGCCSVGGAGAGAEAGLEAAALVAKMARCREDLFPALRRMGSRGAVVGTAIKEMEVLRANLETYREVWDGSGNRGDG